jgi:carbonic anhydrase
MVSLMARKQPFIDGLIERAGWTKEHAEEYFMNYVPMFEINNEIDFILSEVKRLRVKYPKVKVVPMLFKVEDGRLYLLRE